jgi:hypothetical protein
MRHMEIVTALRVVVASFSLIVLTQCAATKQNKQWDNIDYSKVRNRDTYENDKNYRLPSVYGCTNDDLYNCN